MNKVSEYFLTVSSLNYRKNFVSVLQAFSLYCEKNQNGDLYIIGDLVSNSFRGVDISKYKQNSRIKILGRVSDDDLVKYYCNAICFIFPSLYEGFGIPVIEAQACGCPVISSNSSSLPEVLGDSAIMCDPLNIAEISNAMNLIINDKELRNNLIIKGFENSKRFSWEMSANIILKIVSKLM